MSFLGDLINTIGGDRAPAPPLKPLAKPVTTNTVTSNPSRSASNISTVASQVKSGYKGTAGSQAAAQGNILKRKADDAMSDRPVKVPKPILNSNSDISGQNPSKLNGNGTRSPAGSNSLVSPSTLQHNDANTAKLPVKAPSKGSYAAMMAKAKEAQQVKTPSQVGMIKHQTTTKIKTSKLAERKKEEQEKAKAPVPAHLSKPGQRSKPDPRRRSASPLKKSDAGLSKQIKAPRPPLHGPAPIPSYKGTMNQAPKKSREDVDRKKRNKYDDYLGTDEEEDDDDGYGYGGGNDYYSGDESDDMEGGFDDMLQEDRLAEQHARDEDAREQALESKLKREKLERKQKLAALAQKRR